VGSLDVPQPEVADEGDGSHDMKEQSEIEKLDLVARAEVTKVAILRARVPLTILSLFFVLLAVISGASFNETLAVRLLATLAVMTTVLLWLESRLAVYGMALLFFAVLAGSRFFSDDPDSHTLLGSTAKIVVSAMVLLTGYRWWTNATPFTSAQSKGLDNERIEVAEWLRVLKSSSASNPLVEFSTKSFVRGYWTYRLLNTGSCWAAAKFKTGKMNRLLDFRVLGLKAVHVAERPAGRLNVEMGDRVIQDVEISAEMRDRLLRLVSAES
jgi:hypothetical protein